MKSLLFSSKATIRLLISLSFLASGTSLLVGCSDDNVQAPYYQNPQECINAHRFTEKTCNQEWEKAVQVDQQNAPRYEDPNDCKELAQSTGITTKFTPLREFGVDEAGYPVDQDNWRITHMFKLYPWENLFKEIKSLKTWGLRDRILDGSVKVIEPAWKALLSNKGIWPIMWREFPHSRHLLPSYFETDMSPEATALQTKIHVRKPIIGREGASVSIVDPDPRVGALVERPSPYGEEGYIVQEFLSPEKFGQYYAVIGSWYIDDTCGMAIRVDRELITGNRSIFVPHYIGSLHW